MGVKKDLKNSLKIAYFPLYLYEAYDLNLEWDFMGKL